VFFYLKKRIRRRLILFRGFFILALVTLVTSAAGVTAQAEAQDTPGSFAELVKKASPSVVNISAEKVIKGVPFHFQTPFGPNDPFRDFFERFFRHQMPRKFKQKSLGSGFIIDKEGYILTNNHVVEQTEEIMVTLHDDREYKAEIIGRDPKTDLALIKIDADNAFEPVPLGDSDALQVGDWVVAIGNPFGLGNTVTAGIVSSKFRQIGAGPYDDFIQTDAPINPGNSGGPLLNVKGEVVGINTAIFTRSGGSIGIGFAVPVNMAKDLLPQLKEGKVIRGWLGVMIQEVTPELKEKLGLEQEKGALVADVTPNGPADKAGLQRGDVIVSFDGEEIEEMNELPFRVASTPVGKMVKVEVIRKEERKSFDVKVGKLEGEEGKPAVSEAKNLGMNVQEITPDLAARMGLSETEGLVVVHVETHSSAAEAGIRTGDIILEIDQEPVEDIGEFSRRTQDYKPGETILFLVKRGEQTIFLTLKVREQN
jgi:serine protease Do